MMKDRYSEMLDKVGADEALVEKTIAAAQGKRRISMKWTGIVAAACAACMVVSVPVIAAHLSAIQEMLNRVDPIITEEFGTETLFCESEGIRLEVGEIRMNGNTAEVRITMQDLAGDRLHADTVFYDFSTLSLSLADQGTSSITSCETTGYDPGTKTLSALLKIEFYSGHIMPSEDLINFSVKTLMNGRKESNVELPEVNLSTMLSETLWTDERLAKHAFMGSDAYAIPEGDDPVMLAPMMEEKLAEDVYLTAAGFVDGQLHIQLRYDARLMDNHGSIWLQNENGEVIECAGAIDAYLMEKPPGAVYQPNTADNYYWEYVFDITEASLADYHLWGRFAKYTERMEGDWQVTFVLPEKIE